MELSDIASGKESKEAFLRRIEKEIQSLVEQYRNSI